MRKLIALFVVLCVASSVFGMGEIRQWMGKKNKTEQGSSEVKPQSGSVKLLSVKQSAKDGYIDFKYTDNSHWPVQTYADGSKINGWLLINGKRCEQFRPGYTQQHLKNIYGNAPYGQRGIKTGDKVRISIQSRDGKETSNEVEFIWPWRNT